MSIVYSTFCTLSNTAYMSGHHLLIICKLSHQAAITLLSGDRSCSVAAAAAEVLQQSWQKSAAGEERGTVS